jgi:hypothetical protein
MLYAITPLETHSLHVDFFLPGSGFLFFLRHILLFFGCFFSMIHRLQTVALPFIFNKILPLYPPPQGKGAYF